MELGRTQRVQQQATRAIDDAEAGAGDVWVWVSVSLCVRRAGEEVCCTFVLDEAVELGRREGLAPACGGEAEGEVVVAFGVCVALSGGAVKEGVADD